MARILFAAKDNGCSSVTEEVAVLARGAGHDVMTVLEGLAMARYEKLGFPVRVAPNRAGCVDFRAPTDEEKGRGVDHFDAHNYLRAVSPDIIVTGLGSPINIQRDIAEEATRHGVPLVVCEDFWAKSPGHLDPTKVWPHMILTVDSYSTALNARTFPNQEHTDTQYRERHNEQHIVGNPGVKKVEVSSEVRAQVEALRGEFGAVYVFAGGGPASCTAELDLLLQCLAKTPGKWCLVPRFHPKYAKLQLSGMEKPYGGLWAEYLAPFADRVRYVDAPSTDPIACVADVVASGFSTLLSTALWNGVPGVCLRTPETIASLKAHGAHYDEIPQVALGLVPAVIAPTDLSPFGKMPSDEVMKKLVPYDAKLAWQHIRTLL